MARKFLMMGFTKSRRYANHSSGQKYAKAQNLESKKLKKKKLRTLIILIIIVVLTKIIQFGLKKKIGKIMTKPSLLRFSSKNGIWLRIVSRAGD